MISWTFSAQTHLNFHMNLLKVKIRKEHKKYFVAHQKISKIFYGPSIFGQNIL